MRTISEREYRAVVTKDADVVNSFLALGESYKLLLVAVGNIGNVDLQALFVPRIAEVSYALSIHDYIELIWTAIIAHTRGDCSLTSCC